MAIKTEKTYKRMANIAERKRLAYVLKFLKEEKYIANYTAFLTKYGLRNTYLVDLRRPQVSMYISDVVVAVYTDFPVIRKEWLTAGTGRMTNLQFRNERGIKNNDMYERWELMAKDVIKEYEEEILNEMKKENPEYSITPTNVIETTQTISTQNINAMIEYLMAQLSERDKTIQELKNEIEQMKKAVEN